MKLPSGIWRNVTGGRVRWEFVDPRSGRRVKRADAAAARSALAEAWAQVRERWLKVAGTPREVIEAIEERRRELGWDWARMKLHVLAGLQSASTAAVGPGFTVAEAVERFLEGKTLRGCRARTLSDLRSRLGWFKTVFHGGISEVRADAVQRAILSRRGWSARTRNNYLGAVQNLFNSPELAECPQGREIARLQPIDLETPEKAIWSPAEMAELLMHAQLSDQAVIPVLCLGAFGGLRTSEAIRLDASRLRLKDRCLIIIAGTTKVKTKRKVPLPGNLVEWLRAFAPRSGPMWVGHENTLHRRLRRLCARAGLAWRANGLRESASTYRHFLNPDLEAQSREFGNSPRMLAKHYVDADAADDEAAAGWFAIRPGVGIQKILPFPDVPFVSPRGGGERFSL